MYITPLHLPWIIVVCRFTWAMKSLTVSKSGTAESHPLVLLLFICSSFHSVGLRWGGKGSGSELHPTYISCTHGWRRCSKERLYVVLGPLSLLLFSFSQHTRTFGSSSPHYHCLVFLFSLFLLLLLRFPMSHHRVTRSPLQCIVVVVVVVVVVSARAVQLQSR